MARHAPTAPLPARGLRHVRQPKNFLSPLPDLQAAFSARVRQGSRMSDVIREALEAHLGVRPTDRPTAPALSDTLADVSDRLATLALDWASEG